MESSPSDAIGGIVFLGIMLVCVVVALATVVFWVWMLIHSITNPGLTGSEKIAWVLVVLFAQIIGAIIYFFVARPKASKPLPVSSGPS